MSINKNFKADYEKKGSDDNAKNILSEEKSIYQKVLDFFEENKVLNYGNFENFVNCMELNLVFNFEDLGVFWKMFTNSENKDLEYDFNTTLELVEKIGTKYSEHKASLDDLDEEDITIKQSKKGNFVHNFRATNTNDF